jgi:hypothetical protein
MFFYTVDYTIRILEIIVKINKKTTQSATAKSPTLSMCFSVSD